MKQVILEKKRQLDRRSSGFTVHIQYIYSTPYIVTFFFDPMRFELMIGKRRWVGQQLFLLLFKGGIVELRFWGWGRGIEKKLGDT